jgi:hypothetical protein
MALEYDPVRSLQHFPLPMRKYGLNPYGENLYRIVLASSRRKLVGGTWPDGTTAYHWTVRYPKEVQGWIPERWRSAFDYTGMTQMQYDQTHVDPVSGWLINGPYPSRGEYELAWEFEAGVAADSLDKIVGTLERSRYRSFSDVQRSNKAEYAKEDVDQRAASSAEIRDAMTAFGGRAFSSARVARGIKTVTPLKTAEELGLPIPRTRPRASRSVSMRRTIDVRDIQVQHTLSVRAQGAA